MINRVLARCLQVAIVALGLGILAALLWEPTVEGVNANATTLSEIYFDDPFLAYIYVSFIAVFVGFYQVFKLLGYIGGGDAYSQKSVKALRAIRRCVILFAAFMFGAVVFIVITQYGKDDIAGGVAMGLFLIIGSGVVAAAAAWLGRVVSKRVRIS